MHNKSEETLKNLNTGSGGRSTGLGDQEGGNMRSEDQKTEIGSLSRCRDRKEDKEIRKYLEEISRQGMMRLEG